MVVLDLISFFFFSFFSVIQRKKKKIVLYVYIILSSNLLCLFYSALVLSRSSCLSFFWGVTWVCSLCISHIMWTLCVWKVVCRRWGQLLHSFFFFFVFVFADFVVCFFNANHIIVGCSLNYWLSFAVSTHIKMQIIGGRGDTKTAKHCSSCHWKSRGMCVLIQ